MCKLPFGTSKVEKLFDIDTDLIITHFLYVEGFGFLFLFRDSHCIGYIDGSNKFYMPWMGVVGVAGNNNTSVPTFEYPSSVCYMRNMKFCYLLEKGGSRIRRLDLGRHYVDPVLGESENYNLNSYFSKCSNRNLSETHCDADEYGNLYWSVRDLHRCFRMDSEFSTISNYVGNGRSNFGTSNNLSSYSLSHPRGVKCINKSLYIADCGNHCLREIIGRSVKIVLGHPLKSDLSSPSQIKYSNRIIYIKNDNQIHYIALNDKSNGVIYSSSNIDAIDVNSKRDLLILERT